MAVARPVRGRPHVARAPQGPATLRPLNQKQINKLADQQTAAQMAGAQAPIQSEQAMTDTRYKAAQAALQGFGLAAAKLYSPPSDVQKIYSDAAQETAGIAGGFSGQAGQDLAAKEKANADFMAQQAPGATPQGEPDPSAVHDAMYYQEGYLPAANLEAQGAAAASTQAGMPLLQTAATRQDILGSQAKNTEDDQQYVQAMLDLAAKEPDMRNQILDHLYTREQQKFSMRIQQQAQDLYQEKFGVQAAQGQERLNIEARNSQISARRMRIAEQQGNARLALEAGNLKLSQARQRQSVRQALINGQRIDSSASHSAGYLIDRDNNPILDKNGKRIPVTSGSGSKKTPAQTGPGSQAYKEAYRYASTHYPVTYLPGGVVDPRGNPKVPFSEQQSHLVNAYGITRPQARKILIGLGIKPDGKRSKKKTTGT